MCMSSLCSHRHTHTITLALSHSLMQSYTPTHHHTPTSHPITLTTIVTSCFDNLTFLSLPSARILKGRKPKLPDCKSKHFDPMFITVQLAAARLTSYWAHSQVTIHGMGYTLGMRLTWSCIVCECESPVYESVCTFGKCLLKHTVSWNFRCSISWSLSSR